jgi:ASC-1-like (ASCH) protein
MPLFPVRKQVFEWVREKKRTVEIREGKSKKGDEAVFRSGKEVVRRPITERREGHLRYLLLHYGFKRVIPTVHTLEETLRFYESLGCNINGIFTAYVLAGNGE